MTGDLAAPLGLLQDPDGLREDHGRVGAGREQVQRVHSDRHDQQAVRGRGDRDQVDDLRLTPMSPGPVTSALGLVDETRRTTSDARSADGLASCHA